MCRTVNEKCECTFYRQSSVIFVFHFVSLILKISALILQPGLLKNSMLYGAIGIDDINFATLTDTLTLGIDNNFAFQTSLSSLLPDESCCSCLLLPDMCELRLLHFPPPQSEFVVEPGSAA
jgi:hypothetical protein